MHCAGFFDFIRDFVYKSSLNLLEKMIKKETIRYQKEQLLYSSLRNILT